MKKTVFILGGSTMQMPSIKIAKEKGWRVIVADGNPAVEGRKFADHFAHIDLKDVEGMEKAARYYHELFGLSGIFTAGTDFSTTVAYVAQKLNLPGIPYEVACNATDKAQMRTVLKTHGVPCPDFFMVFNNGKSFSRSLSRMKSLSLPLVVKPVDNMGARGVRRVDSPEELKIAVQEALSNSRSSRAIVEEYMEGPELSLDAIIYNGNITICGVADRHIFFPPYFVEMGHTMPTHLRESVVKDVVDVFKKGICALGIVNGAAKGDIKVTGEGPKVVEIAARLSGGYMSGWTYPYSTGIEVTEAALRIAVGLPPGHLNIKDRYVSAERAFISIPGTIHDIEGYEKARHTKNIMTTFCRVQPGERVVFPRNNVEKCGNIISKASLRKDAVVSAEKAVQSIIIRLEPDNSQTEDFLLSRTSEPWLDAISFFQLKDRHNVNAYHEMIPYDCDNLREMKERFSIIGLPSLEKENTRDWHGNTIAEAFKTFQQVTGICVRKQETHCSCVLGKIFWKFFLKGGIQGGLYMIDSLDHARKQLIPLKQRLSMWER